MTGMSITRTIAQNLGVSEQQVQSAVDLLDGGATVPFIARYRKEATGGLDDVQLRALEQSLTYLREMAARRDAIIKSIDKMSGGANIALSSVIAMIAVLR